MATHELISDLAIVTGVAAVTGMAARRFAQPSILGYLLAGLIVGPYIPIPLFADPHRIEALAEIGVVLVMFAVGLEFRIKRLLEILPVSGSTALVQIAVLLWAGFSVGSVLGWSVPASITLGATIAISSTMVVSGVLRTQPVDAEVRSHVFGVLVVQDVVAIVLMAVVTTLAAGQTLDPTSLLLLIAELAGVVLTLLLLGMVAVPRLVRAASRLGDSESLAVLAVGVSFTFAALAGAFGYSPALGAFISGMVVSESGRGKAVEHAIDPLRAMFSSIFFVSIGMTVDPAVAWNSLPLALLLTAVVVVMQLVSVSVASVLSGNSMRTGLIAGLALGQVGELSFILATIAMAGGLVPPETLPALVTVATITAFTTPLLLRRGDWLVHTVDRLLPDGVHHVLAAYNSVIRQAQTEREGPSLRRPALALLLDWSALLLLVLLRSPLRDSVPEAWSWAVDLGAVVAATPFVFGLFRSGARWVSAVGERSLRSNPSPALARTVEAMAVLAVVVWISLPTLAIARPLVRGSLPEIGAIAALVLAAGWLVRRQGGFTEAYTSEVARIALRIAIDEPETAPEAVHASLEGLDHVPVTVPVNANVVGRSLTELDLRSLTGATVIAICHGEDQVLLPTGHERLKALDRLAISGAPEAIERARVLLSQPAEDLAPGA